MVIKIGAIKIWKPSFFRAILIPSADGSSSCNIKAQDEFCSFFFEYSKFEQISSSLRRTCELSCLVDCCS